MQIGFRSGDYGVVTQVRYRLFPPPEQQTLSTSSKSNTCTQSCIYFTTLTLFLFVSFIYFQLSPSSDAKFFLENYITIDKELKGTEVDSQPIWISDGHAQIISDVIDQDFKLKGPIGTLSMKRIVQYCQWIETKTEEKKRAFDSNIEIIETRYEYFKDWRDNRISSRSFNSPVAFNNPDRNPFPSQQISSTLVIGEENSNILGLVHSKIDSFDQFHFETIEIPVLLQPTVSVLRENCFESDGIWIYCPSYDTPHSSLTSFLFDKVIDIGGKGKCNPGDIRIRFDVAILPMDTSLSFAAILKSTNVDMIPIPKEIDSMKTKKYLLPIPFGGVGRKTHLFRQGKVEASDVLSHYVYDAHKPFVVILIIFGFIGLLLFIRNRVNNRNKTKLQVTSSGIHSANSMEVPLALIVEEPPSARTVAT